MLAYAGLIGFISITGILLVRNGQKKRNIIFMVLAFLALTFVAGFRAPTVGTDTINYCNIYTQFGEAGHWPTYTETNKKAVEYVFGCFEYVLYLICKDPQFLLIVTSIIINAAFCFFIYKNTKNPLLAVLIYICFLIFFENMNTMREALGLSIVLFAFPLLKKKKWWSLLLFGLCVCFGATFHYSVAFLLLLIPIVLFRISYPTVAIIIVLLIPFYIYAIPLYEIVCELFGKSPTTDPAFLNNGEYMHSIIAMCIILFATLMIFINEDKKKAFDYFKSPRCQKQYEETSFFLYAFIFYFIFTLVATKNTIYSRFADLFAPFVIVGIPHFLQKLPPKKRTIFSAVVAAIFVSYFVAIYLIKPTYENMWQYSFFWQV